MSREDILLLRDQNLLDYYDNCIKVFEEYQVKVKKAKALWEKYWCAYEKWTIVFYGWITALIILVLGVTVYWEKTHPENEMPVFEDDIFFSEKPDLILRHFSEEQIAKIRLIGDRIVEVIEDGIEQMLICIIIFAGIALIVLFTLFLTKRKAYRSQYKSALQESTSFTNQVIKEIEEPSGKLDDAFVMFADIYALDMIKELRKIVFEGLASSHYEAMKEFQRQKERSEDKKWRDDFLKAVKEGNKKDFLDMLEKVGSFTNHLKGHL